MKETRETPSAFIGLVHQKEKEAPRPLENPTSLLPVDTVHLERGFAPSTIGAKDLPAPLEAAPSKKETPVKRDSPASVIAMLDETPPQETPGIAQEEAEGASSSETQRPAQGFFDRHIARGEGEIRIGESVVTFSPDGTGRVNITKLSEKDRVALLILDLAAEYGVSVGFWGGSAKDLLLGRPRSSTSDIDIVYDSRDANFKEFRKELISRVRQELGDSAPQIDFAVDRNPEVQMRGPYRGVTIEKLAILSDGAVYDFTGKGLRDLASGILRYNCPEPYSPPGISSIIRMVGSSIQNQDLRFDPVTEKTIREVMEKYYGPDSENVQKIRAFKKESDLIGAKTLDEFFKKHILEEALLGTPLEGLLERGKKHKYEGRKRYGENYLDFSSTLKKIVKGGMQSDPVRALHSLKKYGIVEFLSSIGAQDDIKPLAEKASLRLDSMFAETVSRLNNDARTDNVRLGLLLFADNIKNRGQDDIARRIEKAAESISYSDPPEEEPFVVIEKILKPIIDSGEIKKEDLEETLHAIFFRKRGTKIFCELFYVEPASRIPSTSGPYPEKTVKRGFDAEVDSIELAEPHSLKDVEKYVRVRVGEFLIKDAVENNRVIEIHSGSKDEALASLAARGFSRFARISAPRSSQLNQIYLAQSDSGEIRYVFTEIYGKDRMTHIQHLLRRASHDGVHLSPLQVEIHRDTVRDKIDSYRRYSRALLRSGVVPSKVVIGFKNTLIRELQIRQQAAEKLANLKEKLGDKPFDALLLNLQNDPTPVEEQKEILIDLALRLEKRKDLKEILELTPQKVFSSFEASDKIKELEGLLADAAAKAPASSALASLIKDGKIPCREGNIAKAVGDYYSDQGLITYVDADGKRNALLLVRTPYGEACGDLGRALSDYGAGEVILTGTAGGLRKDSALGEIDLPRKIASCHDETQVEINNSLAEFIRSRAEGDERFKDFRLDAATAEVSSPLEETSSLIKALQSKGYDLVEIECSDLVRSLARDRSSMAFSSAHIISDIPGTDRTLDSFCPRGPVEQAVRKLTDALIDYMKISRVEYQPEELVLNDAANFRNASSLAENLMKSEGLDLAGRELMHYNLIRYLINGTTPEGLTWLSRNFKGKPSELPEIKMLNARWLDKIKRTFDHPFTNDEVLLNLASLGEKLKRTVRFIRENGGKTSPYRIYLMGSATKGRLGSTSDMDVLVDTKDNELMEKVIDSEFGYRGAKDPAFTAGPFNYAANRMDFFKPAVNIGDGTQLLEDPKFLENLYIDIAKKYGVIIETDDGTTRVRIDEDAAARLARREVPQAAEKVLEYEKRYRDFINTDFVLQYLKDAEKTKELAHIPLARLIDIGEDLAKAYLPHHFTYQSLVDFLKTPRGGDFLKSKSVTSACAEEGIEPLNIPDAIRQGKGLKVLSAIPMEDLPEIMSLSDPVECLALLYAGAERLRNSHSKSCNPFHAELAEATRNW